MKKWLIALVTTFLVGMITVTASAADLSKEEFAQAQAEYYDAIACVPYETLRGEELESAYAEALRNAGWTVIEPAAAPSPQSIDIDPEILELAYSDLESASPEMKEKIRAARNEVIYHPSMGWAAAETIMMTTVDYETKEVTIEPRFEDLFPGWELPGNDTAADEAEFPEMMEMSLSAPTVDGQDNAASFLEDGLLVVSRLANDIVISFDGDVALYNPSKMMSTPFCQAPTLEHCYVTFETWANQFVQATSVNYGYSNPHGTNLGYKGGLGLYGVSSIFVSDIGYVNVRASTNGPEGYAWTIVRRTYNRNGM